MDTVEVSNDEQIPYINSIVGTLVWVRRRNGSWWPGRILAPEELPGAHLLSPRTGTPVKLLGREDGSVDWYNIEKSRRVKAFRCGEFDACIEKARSLASVLSKKREKYARREDAILHALELEKELVHQPHLQAKMFSLGLNYEQLSEFVNKSRLSHGDMSPINFQRSLMGPGVTNDVDDASFDSLFSFNEHRRLLDVELEEDFTDSLLNMRGLQDLVLEIDSPKEEKASWSFAYEQFPSTTVAGKKKKVASSITKSAVDGMAPNSIRVLKKKRSVLSNLMEDESTHKKQKAIPGPSNSNGNFADGAFELGSKVCFSQRNFNAGRNGYASLLDKVPIKYKLSKGRSGSEGWEPSLIESRCRDDMLSFLPLLDKSCPSFADHQKPSCCSGRPYLYEDSQIEVASSVGSLFVDSLLQGGPASRCSFSPGAAYADSAIRQPSTEVERANSVTCTLPSSSQTWPSYNHTEFAPGEVIHESASRRQSANIYPTYGPDYAFKTSMISNASAMHLAHSDSLLDHILSDKRRPCDAEGPFISGSDLNVNTITFSRHLLSPVAEEDAGEGSFSGEDEADSFQQIPGSSLSSPDATVVCATNGHLKQEPLFEDTSESTKVLVDIASENRILVEDESGGEGCCAATGSGSSSEECDDMIYKQFLSKWQTKGRRMAHARSRTLWGLLPAGATEGRPGENVKEHMAPNAVKAVGKRSRRPRRIFGLASCSEGEEEQLPTQISGKVGADHAAKVKLCQVSQVISTYWFNVPIDFRDAAFQPLVSIMSELIGKPIVGYSVLVEKIAKKSEEDPRYVGGNATSRDSMAQPFFQPTWRTARRTAMQRVPRSCGVVVSLNHAGEAVGKQQHENLHNGQTRGMRKYESRFGFSGVERTHQKKLASLPQKMRMLSSIAAQSSDKCSEPGLKVSDAPLVTCIPVSVIFNRIREALYRESNNAPSDCNCKS